MKKVKLIAHTTYFSRIRSRSFLLLTFLLPILMIIAGAIPVIRETSRSNDPLPVVGLVDRTDRLALPELVSQLSTETGTLNVHAYSSLEAAQAAWQTGQIDVYLLVPEDYFQGDSIIFYGRKEPSAALEVAIEDLMRQTLVPGASPEVAARLGDPTNELYVAQATGEQVTPGIPMIIRFATPAGLAVVFALLLMFTTGQMGSAIVQEKENRAMEMIITAVRPIELVAGKVLGMGLLSLTQFAIWIVAALGTLGILLAGEVTLSEISIPWQALGWGIILIVPGYLLFAVTSAGLGILAGDAQHAQQMAGLLGFVGLAPIWFTTLLINNPQGPVAVGLTLFPFTAPIVALFRMAITDVPFWQLTLSAGMLALTLGLMVWIVARIFRIAMLMYGKTLKANQVWRALRSA